MTKRLSSYGALPFSALIGRAALLQFIREHLDKCGINGAYYEFGVFNGSSMIEAYYILREQVSHYIGFDSFKGLPQLSDIDEQSVELQPQFTEGNFHSSGFDVVKQMILASGIDYKSLLLYEGYFSDILTKDLQEELLKKSKASIVHLDADLYSSTKQSLDFIYPFLQTGTWLLCDDYWTYSGASSCGTQKALKEFLSEHEDVKIQEYCSYKGWSKAFIVEML